MSIEQHYEEYRASEKPKIEWGTDPVTGKKGYWTTDTYSPDNNPNDIRTERTFHEYIPSTPIENITDGSWPPKVGAYYNGKGPITKEGDKYGYSTTEMEPGYGGRMDSRTIFHEVTKPLSKEELDEVQKSKANAKNIYDTNGPIGAPKVLAAVHIAHPRLYTKTTPYVPVGSFVLAFYTLKQRTNEQYGRQVKEWYYTKLFHPVPVDGIAKRFDLKLTNKDEFLASSTKEFDGDDFLQRLNQESRVVAWPGEDSDKLFIGKAVALIGFDCDDLNIDAKSTGVDGIVPVKLSNPIVIYVSKHNLKQVLEMIREEGQRPQPSMSLKYLFDNCETLAESKITIDRLKPLKVELEKLETNADRLAAYADFTESTAKAKKSGQDLLLQIDNANKTFTEYETKINERERITREGLNPNKNWLTKTRRDVTKQKEAETYMSTKDYDEAKKNAEETKTQLQNFQDQLSNASRASEVAATTYYNNPLVKEHLKLKKEVDELTQKLNRKTAIIYYDYNGLRKKFQPVFFIDPDFTTGNLIRLVGDKFGITQLTPVAPAAASESTASEEAEAKKYGVSIDVLKQAKKSQSQSPNSNLDFIIQMMSIHGGKRKSKKSIKSIKSKKSKKSMKAKRTIKRLRKHTKKSRRRSYRK